MSTVNTQETNTTPEPYKQNLNFNIEINQADEYEIEVTTKREIEVKF